MSTVRPTRLLLALALAACSRESGLRLAPSSSAAALDSAGVRAMEIASNGSVEIDAVPCANIAQSRAAFLRLWDVMPSSDALETALSVVVVPDGPFVVRVDREARLGDVTPWLRASRTRFNLFRTWIAVTDASTGAERYLVFDTPERLGPFERLDATGKRVEADHRMEINLCASDRPIWSCGAERGERWRVDHWVGTSHRESWEEPSWAAVRAAVERRSASRYDFMITGCLPPDTRWSDVVPILEGALAVRVTTLHFTKAAELRARPGTDG